VADIDDGWGPWIANDGKGCPCKGKMALLRFSVNLCELGYPVGHVDKDGMTVLDPFTVVGVAKDGPSWHAAPGYLPGILCYRLKRPKQLQELVELIREIDPNAHPELMESVAD
jgi:hypothetical protein